MNIWLDFFFISVRFEALPYWLLRGIERFRSLWQQQSMSFQILRHTFSDFRRKTAWTRRLLICQSMQAVCSTYRNCALDCCSNTFSWFVVLDRDSEYLNRPYRELDANAGALVDFWLLCQLADENEWQKCWLDLWNLLLFYWWRANITEWYIRRYIPYTPWLKSCLKFVSNFIRIPFIIRRLKKKIKSQKSSTTNKTQIGVG